MAGREVGKMRQGREGLLSGRGPFAGVWGPFCRKGGLSSIDFCPVFPKLCPGGRSRWRGRGCSLARNFLQWVLGRRSGKRDAEGLRPGRGQDFSGGGSSWGIGTSGSGHHGMRAQALQTKEKIPEARKENHHPPPPLAPYPSPQAPPLPAPPPPAASCCPLRWDDRPTVLIGRRLGGGAEGRIGWRGQRRAGRLIGGAGRGTLL